MRADGGVPSAKRPVYPSRAWREGRARLAAGLHGGTALARAGHLQAARPPSARTGLPASPPKHTAEIF